MKTPEAKVAAKRRRAKQRAKALRDLRIFGSGALFGAVAFIVAVVMLSQATPAASTTTAVVQKAYTTTNTTTTPPNDDIYDTRWDCRTMGNNICGPGNPQGVAPGFYSARDNGVLVITWEHLKQWGLVP